MPTPHQSCALPWVLDSDTALAFARASGHGVDAAVSDAPMPMAVVCGAIPLGVRRVIEDREVISDPSRLRYMVHLEEDITWHRPLEINRPLWVSARLHGRRMLRAGETLQIATQLHDATGGLVVSTRSTVFIRSDAGTNDVASDPVKAAAKPPPSDALAWRVLSDQPERYAAASGEDNPIHLDDRAARQAGLKGRILHGMCTMAFAAGCVVKTHLAGDVSRLKRLRARFGQPVYPDTTVYCSMVPDAEGTIGVQVFHADGQRALSRGLAEVSA